MPSLQGSTETAGVTKLTVVKADGSSEEYLYTKVLAALNNVLGAAGISDMGTVEQLADVVTYYVYHKREDKQISSSEIHSLLKVVLTSTGYEAAAEALTEHNYQRRTKRNRIEVAGHIDKPSDMAEAFGEESARGRSRWDKSVIVRSLEEKYGFDRQSSRAVAAMVEEKIFSMGLTVVPASLVKQLVLHDAGVVMRANKELATA